MIDFRLTDNDKAYIERARAEALICRKYARYYDEHEEEIDFGLARELAFPALDLDQARDERLTQTVALVAFQAGFADECLGELQHFMQEIDHPDRVKSLANVRKWLRARMRDSD